MKPLILLLVAAFLHTGIQAQENRAFVPDEVFNTTTTRTFHFAPSPEGNNRLSNSLKDSSALSKGINQETSNIDHKDLGETYMDRQTYGVSRQQIYQHNDDYVVSVWTITEDYEGGFEDMGTAYSYKPSIGADWESQPDTPTRIESMKSRYPSYAPYGENGEVIVSQQSDGLNVYTRPEKGEGEWEHHLLEPSGDVPALKYPHMITSGENHQVLHIAAVTNIPYEGQESALLYFRSQDGGQTWDQQNVILEGTGSEHYTAIYGDEYGWAQKDSKIALVVTSPWHDLFYLESEDNGDSWQKHMVWEHPYPMFDFETTVTTDTLWCPGGSMDAVYDETDSLHIAFGLTRVMHQETGYDFTHFPWTDGIVHWSESFQPFTASNQHSALSHDNLEIGKHLVGWSVDKNSNNLFDNAGEYGLGQYPNLGMSTMPSLSRQDHDYTIALSYLTPNEERNSGEAFYRNVYAKPYYFTPLSDTLRELGSTIFMHEGPIYDYEEFFYPQLPPWNNSYLFIHNLYHSTPEIYFPGQGYFTQVMITEYDKYWWEGNPLPFTTGINQSTSTNRIRVSPNHPNPFSGQTLINVKLPSAVTMHLEVRDMQGKKVYTHQIKGHRGNNHIILPATNLKPGIYLYTVSAGEKSITRKMVVKE
ncbi:MAG: T9SS type A sorting domain-containing protein [Bacteroidales bacterium]|nr:T9SS type A sorting domain-containing protein [Bacteroidales bacterium]MCF8333968.1 T9SS type A sorting domain-containing protein [Bacteroidales bacterium]